MAYMKETSIVLKQLRLCEKCRKPMGKGSTVMKCISENGERHWICLACYKKVMDLNDGGK